MSNLKEIAALSGVSLSTVSIVLRGEGAERGISEETQRKVMETAKNMGYSPNIAARRLRQSRKKNSVVVFWPTDYRASLVFQFLQGIYQALGMRTTDFEIIIYPYSPNTLHKVATPASLSAYSAAIICTAADKDLRYLDKNKFFTPIVLYNRILKDYPCVIVDSYAMGAYAAAIMLADGIRESVVVTHEPAYTFAQQRLKGFQDAYAASGGHCTVARVDMSEAVPSCVGIDRELFASGKRVGIFCTADQLLGNVCKYCEDAGINARSQLKVVTVCTKENEIYGFLFSDISMIRVPMKKMGVQCMKLIENLLDRKSVENGIYTVDFR